MELNNTEKPYRARFKDIWLLGYRVKNVANPEGSQKKYTRYWVDPQYRPAKIVGTVGNEQDENRILKRGTKTGTETGAL